MMWQQEKSKRQLNKVEIKWKKSEKNSNKVSIINSAWVSPRVEKKEKKLEASLAALAARKWDDKFLIDQNKTTAHCLSVENFSVAK